MMNDQILNEIKNFLSFLKRKEYPDGEVRVNNSYALNLKNKKVIEHFYKPCGRYDYEFLKSESYDFYDRPDLIETIHVQLSKVVREVIQIKMVENCFDKIKNGKQNTVCILQDDELQPCNFFGI